MTVLDQGTGNDAGERLDSWKAISAYMGRDAGTVRRWERTLGLPVRRVPGGKGSSVFAYTAELDAWLRSAPPEPSSPVPPVADALAGATSPVEIPTAGRWWWALSFVAIAVAALLGWSRLPRPGAPADLRVTVTEHAVTATAPDGRAMWVHELADGFRHIVPGLTENTRVIKTDPPGVYFITANRFTDGDTGVEGGELTSLDLDGRPRWTFRFDDELRVGGESYGAPWGVTAFAIAADPGPRRIAVAAHHWVWGPSIVTVLDDRGQRTGSFFNDGWIEQLHWLARDRLVIGGFSESGNGGLLALLKPSTFDGQSPEAIGSPHHCDNCGTNLPLRMAVFPRTEVNVRSQSQFNRALVMRTADRLIVRTAEVPAATGAEKHGVAEAIYEFTHTLDFVRASFSPAYWQVHDLLQAKGQVTHDRAHCPDREGPPPFQVWTPDAGWRTHPSR